MEGQAIETIDPVTLQFLEYNGLIALIGLIGLVITIIYSFKKGGIREVLENTFLGLLLFAGVTFIATHPVVGDDEIVGGLFFIAFGLCRIAKNLAYREAN